MGLISEWNGHEEGDATISKTEESIKLIEIELPRYSYAAVFTVDVR